MHVGRITSGQTGNEAADFGWLIITGSWHPTTAIHRRNASVLRSLRLYFAQDAFGHVDDMVTDTFETAEHVVVQQIAF